MQLTRGDISKTIGGMVLIIAFVAMVLGLLDYAKFSGFEP